LRIYDEGSSNNLSKNISNSATYNPTKKAYFLIGNIAYLNWESFVANFKWEASLDFKLVGSLK